MPARRKYEDSELIKALQDADGIVNRAARQSGINHETFYQRIRRGGEIAKYAKTDGGIRTPVPVEAIKADIANYLRNELVRIIQEPELKQIGYGKALQINIQIVGDSAIERAVFGNVIDAIKFALIQLPSNRMALMKLLTKIAAHEVYGTRRGAAIALGISERAIGSGRMLNELAKKEIGSGTFRRDPGDSRESPIDIRASVGACQTS